VNGLIVIAVTMLALLSPAAVAKEGNAALGERNFRTCAPCHSLEPGHNMTGPSLASLWNRKAGSLPEFERFSAALKSSGIVWNDQTLDQWIADPQHLVPNNEMPFEGIKDASARADLLAFLKGAAKANAAPQRTAQGGMGGMMGGGPDPNLKKLDPGIQVKAITYCHDTYRVTTADGKTRAFWERNLRFKTDSSKDGPEKDAPAILPAGMVGDRASVIFATPGDISKTIEGRC
jgi:cytochrome c